MSFTTYIIYLMVQGRTGKRKCLAGVLKYGNNLWRRKRCEKTYWASCAILWTSKHIFQAMWYVHRCRKSRGLFNFFTIIISYNIIVDKKAFKKEGTEWCSPIILCHVFCLKTVKRIWITVNLNLSNLSVCTQPCCLLCLLGAIKL